MEKTEKPYCTRIGDGSTRWIGTALFFHPGLDTAPDAGIYLNALRPKAHQLQLLEALL